MRAYIIAACSTLLFASAVVPLLAAAQTSTVGGYCAGPSDCTGPNETCNLTTNACELTQAGVDNVINSQGGQTAPAGQINVSKLQGFKDQIVFIINFILVPLLYAVAFIVFLYGVFHYFILGAADDKKREEGRKFVMYGVLGFVIISSVWGLVWIVMNVLGFTGADTHPKYPAL